MSSGKPTFIPNDWFHQKDGGEYKGTLRIEAALRTLGIKGGNAITTSRDPSMPQLKKELTRHGMPDGFHQWQLPIVIGGTRPAYSFITVGLPMAEVPEHTHKDDSVFDVLISGSITFKGTELSAGDWYYVPKGIPYSFTVGPFGCTMLHLYNGPVRP
jgi:hypothetical protein